MMPEAGEEMDSCDRVLASPVVLDFGFSTGVEESELIPSRSKNSPSVATTTGGFAVLLGFFER